MLATFGLERLESSLEREVISAADVAEFLDQAEASDVDTLARDGMDSALSCLLRRLNEQDSAVGGIIDHRPAPGLPTRPYFSQLANTEFQQTRHVNPV
jgi:hypothetical protein